MVVTVVVEQSDPGIRNERPYVTADECCRLFLEKPPSPAVEDDFDNPDFC